MEEQGQGRSARGTWGRTWSRPADEHVVFSMQMGSSPLGYGEPSGSALCITAHGSCRRDGEHAILVFCGTLLRSCSCGS